jgi:phage baseplate assembly protein W
MAQIINNKYPLDSQKRKAIGFGFPLDGNAVFIPTYTTREQIKANLLNFVLTNKGERVFNPNFGGNLRTLFFQQIDDVTEDQLITIIQDGINLYFPSVQVQEIKFDKENGQTDRNVIQFILTYQVQNFGITDELNISLQ